MRAADKSDFNVSVPKVGTFVFGRRKMADHIKINVEYARLTENVEPTPWLDTVCTWLAQIRVLAVRVPEGFDLDELDPLDDDTYARLRDICEALRVTEASFRKKAAPRSEDDGQGAVGGAGVLVPPSVQPDGNGPAVP